LRGHGLSRANGSIYPETFLFVNGDRDVAVTQAAVREAYEKAASGDKTFKVFGGEHPGLHWGHIDLIFGRHAPEITWPYMLEWMNRRLSR